MLVGIRRVEMQDGIVDRKVVPVVDAGEVVEIGVLNERESIASISISLWL